MRRITRSGSGVLERKAYTIDDNAAYIEYGQEWQELVREVLVLQGREEERSGDDGDDGDDEAVESEDEGDGDREMRDEHHDDDDEYGEAWREMVKGVLQGMEERERDERNGDMEMLDEHDSHISMSATGGARTLASTSEEDCNVTHLSISPSDSDPEDPDFNPHHQTLAHQRKSLFSKHPRPLIPAWEFYAPSAFEAVYLLTSLCGAFWYIGSTNNPRTRIRLHNGLVRGVTSRWPGSNIGEITADVTRRPWRMVMLVEGFACNIVSQRFEIQWYKKHPCIKERASTELLPSFLASLLDLLHVERWKGCPLSVRFFDEAAHDIWTQQFQCTPKFRLPPLMLIKDFDSDNNVMPKDWKTDLYKFSPLTTLRREVQDFLLFAAHCLKGKKHFARCKRKKITQMCWVCNMAIRENEGKGQAYSDKDSKSPITVLCSQGDCTAVAHAPCATRIHWAAELEKYGDDENLDIRLPRPTAGKCGECGETNEWEVYRREVGWRLKSTPTLRHKLRERLRVEKMKQRVVEDNFKEALKEYEEEKKMLKASGEFGKAAELAMPRSPPKPAARIRPPVSVDGPRVHPVGSRLSEQDKTIHRALLKMILSQKGTGDVNRPTIMEKIYLGDLICTERFVPWANYDIRHTHLLKSCPPSGQKRVYQISKQNVQAFFDNSSYPWADVTNTRTAGIKACFRLNDMDWAMQEDLEIRRGYGYESQHWKSIAKRIKKCDEVVAMEHKARIKHWRVEERKKHRDESKALISLARKERRGDKKRLQKLRSLERRLKMAMVLCKRWKSRNKSAPPTVDYLDAEKRMITLKEQIRRNMVDGRYYSSRVEERKARAVKRRTCEEQLAAAAQAEREKLAREDLQARRKAERQRRHAVMVEERKRDKIIPEAWWNHGRWEMKKAVLGGKWCRMVMKDAHCRLRTLNGRPLTPSILDMKRAGTWRPPKQPAKTAKAPLSLVSCCAKGTPKYDEMLKPPKLQWSVDGVLAPPPPKVIWTIEGSTSHDRVRYIPLLTEAPTVGVSVAPSMNALPTPQFKARKLRQGFETNPGYSIYSGARAAYPTPSPSPAPIYRPPEESDGEDIGPSCMVKYDPYYFDHFNNPGAMDWSWTPPWSDEDDG